MVLVISVDSKNKAAVAAHVIHELRATGIEMVIAILAESIPLTMVVVAIVTELIQGPVDFGEILIELISAKRVLGVEMKLRIISRHLRDEINRPARLRTELQGCTGADDFDPLNRVEDRSIMGLGKPELLVLDRNAVLQNLHRLAAL